MSNINVNEMVERFGRGFLFASETGFLFYCFNNDKDYYRFSDDDIHKGEDTKRWVEFVKEELRGIVPDEFIDTGKIVYG